jgi:hypothetical protein
MNKSFGIKTRLPRIALAILCLTIGCLQAQNAGFGVTFLENISVPAISEDYCFPVAHPDQNGDVFYHAYRIANGLEYIYTYWYRHSERMFTTPQFAGTIHYPFNGGGLQSLAWWTFADRFIDIRGYRIDFAVPYIHLIAYTYTDDSITSHDLHRFHFESSSRSYYAISADKLLLAPREGLFLYDLNSNEAQSILDQDYYPYYPGVINDFRKLEDGNFLFRRSYPPSSGQPHQWIVLSPHGEMLSYQEITDPSGRFVSARISLKRGKHLVFYESLSAAIAILPLYGKRWL